MKSAQIVLLFITLGFASAFAADPRFLQSRGTIVALQGKPWRAIGVNMPNLPNCWMGYWFHREIYSNSPAFAKTDAGQPMEERLKAAMRAEMIRALDLAVQWKFPFIRYFAVPGYPAEMDRLYIPDRAAYWKGMDELVAECRKRGLRLVPSLGTVFPDYFALYHGGYVQDIFKPGTPVYEAVYGFLREYVTRYADDDTILLWELGNENFLKADVMRTNVNTPGKGTVVAPGKPNYRERYALEDCLTFDQIKRAYREQAAFIKSIDKNHPVTSGDAHVRDFSAMLRKTFPDIKWQRDTRDEFFSNNVESQNFMDIPCLHLYPGPKPGKTEFGETHYQDLIRTLHATGRPLFIGEFANGRPYAQEDPASVDCLKFIDMAEHESVALMAYWVWHFLWQKKDFNVEGDDPRFAPLLGRMKAWNEKYAGVPGPVGPGKSKGR